jgi:hypothetical protein
MCSADTNYKLKKLKQEYKKIKDNKSGSNHCGERWFAIIDSVLCHQPSTLESGVIQSDAMLLELTQPNSPQEVEDSGRLSRAASQSHF